MRSPFCGAAIYKTNGVDTACKLSKTFEKETVIAISKFLRLDYGDTSFEDVVVNEDALKHFDRVLAVYETSKGKLWVIAESENGKEYTTLTVLFPYEY